MQHCSLCRDSVLYFLCPDIKSASKVCMLTLHQCQGLAMCFNAFTTMCFCIGSVFFHHSNSILPISLLQILGAFFFEHKVVFYYGKMCFFYFIWKPYQFLVFSEMFNAIEPTAESSISLPSSFFSDNHVSLVPINQLS